MKKIYVIILLLLLPLNVKALEYNSTVTGEGAIYNYPADGNLDQTAYYQKFFINMTNLSNVGYFEMKVKYDNNVVAIHSCAILFKVSQNCNTKGSVNHIYYTYNKTNEDSSLIDIYPLYTVTLKPVPSTPKSGTTNFVVEFENAKDIEGNDITIRPIIVIISFADNSRIGGNIISAPKESPTKEEDKKDNEQPANPESNNTTTSKSSNNNISKLEIKNYNIIFDKNIINYSVILEENEDSLDINVILEDTKSTTKIIGNENLSSNSSNTILIEVTAENGDKQTYTLKTNVEKSAEKNIVVKGSDKDEVKKKSEFKIEKNHIIIAGTIFGLMLIITIIGKIKDRKLEKALDKL